MIRRALTVMFVVLFCSCSAWAKWKPEEQQYLDNQFRTLQEQALALAKQVEALASELKVLRQDHAQAQAAIITQQRQIDDLQKLVAAVRIGNEDNFTSVKTAISKLREQQEKSFNDLIGRSAQNAAATPTVTQATPVSTVRGYVTVVKGDIITIDVGASQGIQSGSHLYLFKATDLNIPVGEIEVTDAVDASTSHARVVSLNPGVKVEFSDVVRPQ
jgi:hypothetical protein